MTDATDSHFLQAIGKTFLIDAKAGTVYNTKTKRFLATKSPLSIINIYVDKKLYGMCRARLIWLAVNGSIPKNSVIRLKDKNLPASIDNLYLMKNSDLFKNRRKTANITNAKLNEQQVLEIREYGKRKYPIRVIAARYNVSHPVVHQIIKRVIWKDFEDKPMPSLPDFPFKGKEIHPRAYPKTRAAIQKLLAHNGSMTNGRIMKLLKDKGSTLSKDVLVPLINSERKKRRELSSVAA